nr:hypothetical protein GCM10020093_059370 [Planobispora longispora]
MRTAATVGALALATLVLAPSGVHAASSGEGSLTSSTGVSAAVGDPAPTPAPTPTPTPTPTSAPTSEPAPQGTVIDTVAYGSHSRQRMDVWYQPDDLRRPGVFLIHGGWWSSGDKKYMTEISRSYAELGYTVFNINYRLSGDASWPAQRVDAFDAIATARRHSALWSFNPNNYVVIGFSAGGHLATAVGTYKTGGLPGLKGVVGISPWSPRSRRTSRGPRAPTPTSAGCARPPSGSPAAAGRPASAPGSGRAWRSPSTRAGATPPS